mmetsp:Transcript_17285/g.53977  ORF Transcript_17285/g.53977 Transcript_17285/m.53977 type:complete len:204 (-) Transcript_17285:142-753(-)
MRARHDVGFSRETYSRRGTRRLRRARSYARRGLRAPGARCACAAGPNRDELVRAGRGALRRRAVPETEVRARNHVRGRGAPRPVAIGTARGPARRGDGQVPRLLGGEAEAEGHGPRRGLHEAVRLVARALRGARSRVPPWDNRAAPLLGQAGARVRYRHELEPNRHGHAGHPRSIRPPARNRGLRHLPPQMVSARRPAGQDRG